VNGGGVASLWQVYLGIPLKKPEAIGKAFIVLERRTPVRLFVYFD